MEVNKAKENLDTAEKDLKNMTVLNKVSLFTSLHRNVVEKNHKNQALKASLTDRFAKWQEFRRHIALRCKMVFAHHLSNRGYYGKVLFDHNSGTLQLKVRLSEGTLDVHTQYSHRYKPMTKPEPKEETRIPVRSVGERSRFPPFVCCFRCGSRLAVLLDVWVMNSTLGLTGCI